MKANTLSFPFTFVNCHFPMCHISLLSIQRLCQIPPSLLLVPLLPPPQSPVFVSNSMSLASPGQINLCAENLILQVLSYALPSIYTTQERAATGISPRVLSFRLQLLCMPCYPQPEPHSSLTHLWLGCDSVWVPIILCNKTFPGEG